MSLERDRPAYPPKAGARGWNGRMTGWYLRLRLGWASAGIDRLERQLAGEFATLDTAPMQRELELLIAERDALVKRLAERA